MDRPDNKGQALIYVIVFFTFILVLGSILMVTQNSEGLIAIRHENKTEAYYVARSSTEVVSTYLISSDISAPFVQSVTAMTIGDSISTDSTMSFNLAGGEASVEVVKNSANEIEVIGHGTVQGVSEKTSVILNLDTSSENIEFDDVIHADSSLDLEGMDIIDGDVSVSGDGDFEDTKHGTRTGDEDLDAEFDYPEPLLPPELIGVDILAQPTIDSNADIAAYQDDFNNEMFLAFEEIDLDNNEELIIPIASGGEKIVYVDEIYLTSPPNITIDGEGTLIIFVRTHGEFKQFPKSNTAEPSPSQFVLMMMEGSLLEFTANATVEGFVYAPSATVDMQTGHVDFNGAIICDEFDGGNGEITYMAPNFDIDISDYVFGGYTHSHWK